MRAYLIVLIFLCLACAKTSDTVQNVVPESPDSCESPPTSAGDCTASVLKGTWMSPHSFPAGGSAVSPWDSFAVASDCSLVIQASSPSRLAGGLINKRAATSGSVCINTLTDSGTPAIVGAGNHVCSYTVTPETTAGPHRIQISCDGTDFGEYWNYESYHN